MFFTRTISLFLISILIARAKCQEMINDERRVLTKKYSSINSTKEIERQARSLSVWSVYQFANNICQGTGNKSGICVSDNECLTALGSNAGQCATGFGVCCIIELTCGGIVRRNVTYFSNRDYPAVSSDGQSCVLQINKINSRVAQMRLDLEEFTMAGPVNGVCSSDMMVITGHDSDNPIPAICGINNEQHVYVNVENIQGPILVSVTSSGINGHLFRIFITQLEKGSALLAPSECLQYFIGSSGLLKSFNFNSPTPTIGQSNYANNLNYALCIRREIGTCAVRYTATEDENSFNVGLPDRMSGLDGTCIDDYLFIPGARNAPPAQQQSGSRFCGAVLSASPASVQSNPLIYDLAGPIQLTFVTNGMAPSGSAHRGFSIRFQQIPCATVGKR